MEACRIGAFDDGEAGVTSAGIVVRHPNPLPPALGGSPGSTYVGIFADAVHFDAILASVDFSLENVTPHDYLLAALDIMEAHSLFSDQLDWPRVRQNALTVARNPETWSDTYVALYATLTALRFAGDNHSFFRTPERVAEIMETFGARPSDVSSIDPDLLPAAKELTSDIGYVNLPGGGGGGPEFQRLYAVAGYEGIAAVDKSAPCGWIVDLRGNTGGSSPPMVLSVASLLGDGTYIGFMGPDGETTFRSLRGGVIDFGPSTTAEHLGAIPVHQLSPPNPPVAVLIGPRTASAGEVVALAFIERPDTRLFGQTSAGLTTGNTGFLLLDGAAIGLATHYMMDRDGTLYPNGVPPDVEVSLPLSLTGDPSATVPQAAIDWLDQHPACSGTPGATPVD